MIRRCDDETVGGELQFTKKKSLKNLQIKKIVVLLHDIF